MEIKPAAYWRLPLLAAALTAVFWGAWWIVNGSVPSTTSVYLGAGETVVLPCAISRLWDIPAAAAIVAGNLLVLAFVKKLEEGLLSNSPYYGLFMAIFWGFAFGLTAGPLYGLSCGLPIGLGLGIGFAIVFSFPFGLIFPLGLGVVAVLKKVCRRALWQSVGNRLLGASRWVLGH